jgi:DNA-binding GntR family transcriptional regulator
MPFCPILERDIGVLEAVGVLLPQKGKGTFVVSPEFALLA